jgi:CBS domain-containing protein
MSTEVISVRDVASVSDVADMLTRHRITAVAVVDRFDAVIGVVSWTDLTNKIGFDALEGDEPSGRRVGPQRWRRSEAIAADVMSAPPVTIGPDTSLAAAGRTMHRRDVGRLLVIDDRKRLVGIVTRTDLLKVHARLDSVIREEVVQTVLRRTLMIEAGTVKVAVDDGVVILTGGVGRKTTALAAAGLAETVPGVTSVVDRLTFDLDDTLAGRVAIPGKTGTERVSLSAATSPRVRRLSDASQHS